MIRSMTGYGEAERETGVGLLRVEIRTVNHRFFNGHIRTPNGFGRFEASIERWLKAFFSRGHVKYSLSIEGNGDDEGDLGLELDAERARGYRKLLEGLRDELDLPGQVDLATLLRFSSDLFKRADPGERSLEVDEDDLRDVTEEAARAVVEMRESEGARLQEDLEGRLEALDEHLDVVDRRAPARLESERDRIREAIRDLSQREEVDEDRLAREVAYLAEKWDISEEVVRFRSHISLFREILAEDPEAAVGKRLGFVVQEMHREANTIGSKANDAEISAASVAMKEEIERLREQLENVE